MGLLNMQKLFKECKDDDFIYYLNPFIAVREMNTPLDILLLPTIGGKDQLIQAVKIKHIKGIPDEPKYASWVEIEYYRPESILHSPDLAMIPTVKLMFNGTRTFAYTLVALQDKDVKYPVPYCTSRDYLAEFVKKDWGSMSNAFKLLGIK